MATSSTDLNKRPGRNPLDNLRTEVALISERQPKQASKQLALHSEAVDLMLRLERAAYKSRVPARKAEYKRLRNQVVTNIFGIKP